MKIPPEIAKIIEEESQAASSHQNAMIYKLGAERCGRLIMERVEKLLFALTKIEEAERMGYGIHLTYGGVARNALEEWSKGYEVIDFQGLFQSTPEESLPTLAEIEKLYTFYILGRTGNAKARSAKILGMNRRTLYRKELEYAAEKPIDTINAMA